LTSLLNPLLKPVNESDQFLKTLFSNSMKRIFFVTMLLVGIVTIATATEEKPVIDPRLQQSFRKQFGEVASVVWKQSSTGYTASFSKDNTAWAAVYDENAKWSHTVRILFYQQLPLQVLHSIEKKYMPDDVLSIYEYAFAEGENFYLAHIVGKSSNEYVKYYPDGESILVSKQKTRS
jgi:hypothetical protein